jgi:hypothetical protein
MTEPRSWALALVYDKLPLSLNDRSPWQVRYRNARNLRDRVRMLTRTLEIPRLDAIHVDLIWTPRTRRTRDADNAVATLKPAIDGLRDYAPRYRKHPDTGERVLVDEGWTGVVADDNPEHVTWSPPVLRPVDRDPNLTERLVLVITERTPDHG